MKTTTGIRNASLWLMAVMLMARLTAVPAAAAPPALQGQITLRPLTPQEIDDYSLEDA